MQIASFIILARWWYDHGFHHFSLVHQFFPERMGTQTFSIPGHRWRMLVLSTILQTNPAKLKSHYDSHLLRVIFHSQNFKWILVGLIVVIMAVFFPLPEQSQCPQSKCLVQTPAAGLQRNFQRRSWWKRRAEGDGYHYGRPDRFRPQ